MRFIVARGGRRTLRRVVITVRVVLVWVLVLVQVVAML